MKAYGAEGSSWKEEWYARGPLVHVDARPFLGSGDGRWGLAELRPRPPRAQLASTA